MVIFRPHRGGLKEAMEEAMEFDSIDEMLKYICVKHNTAVPFFKIKTSDIYIQDMKDSDERVGWHNLYYLIFERWSKISNQEGYLKYFGIEENSTRPDEERERYIVEDRPVGVIGMFSTDYDKQTCLSHM